MATQSQLDEIDINILKHLQRNGRLSNVELANRVGLSPAPCLRRVRGLERAGVIRRYVTLLNPSALELDVTVFVQVKLDRQVAERFDILERAVLEWPEVLECYVMSGDSDFLLRVVVKDVAEYQRFHREFLSRVESVSSTNSSFALKQVKYFTELPLGKLSTPQQPVENRVVAGPRIQERGEPGRRRSKVAVASLQSRRLR